MPKQRLPMYVKVDSQITLHNPHPNFVAWCEENLVIPNPEFTKKERMGFYTGNVAKTLTLMKWVDGDLVVPYGLYYRIGYYYRKGADRIVPRFAHQDDVDFGCEIPLYDYQEEAVRFMILRGMGILQAPAGSGKTQMGLAIASRIGKRTLWLTHTLDLLNQSYDRAATYMDKKLLGKIASGKVEIGKAITFAAVQTMARLDLTEYRDMFDTVIVDECHRVAGSANTVTQFSRVLNSLAARHKYGLSATVHRADGLIFTTHAFLGDTAYSVSEDEVADKIMKVTVKPVSTKTPLSPSCVDTDGTIIYARLVNYLAGNEERSKLIVQDLIDNADHYNLILSDRLEHLEHMRNALPKELYEQSAIVSGKMTARWEKDLREQYIEDMRSGKKRYLFATFALAKEGLDIPRLDRLYLTTPNKDYAIIAQSVGRVARAFEGKGDPLVYDYVDNIPYCVKAYKQRKTTYRKLKAKVIE